MKNSEKAKPLSKTQMKAVVGGREDGNCERAACEAYCVEAGYSTGTCFPEVNGDCECILFGE